MNNRIVGVIGLLAAGAVTGVHGASAGDDDYFFVDLFLVQHEERVPDRDLGFGPRVGFGKHVDANALGPVSVEFGLFGNPINRKAGRDGHQNGAMFDLVQGFKLAGLDPYVFAGLGAVEERAGRAHDLFPAIEAGAGVWFDAFGKARMRAGLSAMSVRNDEVNDQDSFVDLRFNVGMAWPTGSPAPAAAPRVVDSDGDGLADATDACPSTPASTTDGCPPAAPVVQTDSDGDGVYDAQDECSGTLAGLKVDDKGCAVETVDGQAQSIVLKGVTFLPGSATLTAEAKVVLETATAALSGQKSLKVELGGHTDSQGKDAANQALSQKRADSVRQHLMDKGVEGDRLTAVGYGETQPIADNNTASGRAENRRVEFKIQ